MQQIADWLEKLGMSEYAQRFAENEIDVSVLRHLTDQDLKDIGVSLGHRRKMLAAIAELAGAAPGTAAACADRAEAPRHRRAPPSHRDVLGPRRFDGALRAHGPGGPARGHFGLSEMRRRDRAALRRVRSEVHGRRRARLLRLSAGPRGRRRAGGTGGAGADRSGERAEAPVLPCKPASALRPGWSWSAT